MKFTEQKLQEINAKLSGDIRISNGLNGTVLVNKITVLAELDEIGRLISELQLIKKTIENETGIVLR